KGKAITGVARRRGGKLGQIARQPVASPIEFTDCQISLPLPALMHDPRALPQGDARRWPARHGRPIGRLGHLKILNPGDTLEDTVARGVPDVHAEGECVLVFEDKSDSTRPGPLVFIPYVVAFR